MLVEETETANAHEHKEQKLMVALAYSGAIKDKLTELADIPQGWHVVGMASSDSRCYITIERN